MAATVGSLANVRGLLDLPDIIGVMRFETMLTSWQQPSFQAYEHHPCRTGDGVDWVYFDPFLRRKIDDASAKSRVAAVRGIPDDCLNGWDDVEEKGDWKHRYTGME